MNDYVSLNSYSLDLYSSGQDGQGGSLSLSGLEQKRYPRLVSPSQFAGMAGLTLLYVRSLCSRGQIRCLRVGPKKFLIDPDKAFADIGRLIDAGQPVQCTVKKPVKRSCDTGQSAARRGRPPKQYLSESEADAKRKLKAMAV